MSNVMRRIHSAKSKISKKNWPISDEPKPQDYASPFGRQAAVIMMDKVHQQHRPNNTQMCASVCGRGGVAVGHMETKC